MDKPPIGVTPYYLFAQGRISSLSQAIDGFVMIENPNTELIKIWAKEIMAQCDLLDELS